MAGGTHARCPFYHRRALVTDIDGKIVAGPQSQSRGSSRGFKHFEQALRLFGGLASDLLSIDARRYSVA